MKKFGNVFHFEEFDSRMNCYHDCVLIRNFDDTYKLGVHVDVIFMRVVDGKIFMADRDGVAWKTSDYYDL
jgi:hypothetical protein